jgi:D-aminoacyl-tRNA deacylase
VQRVSRARVTVDGRVVGECGHGLLLLVAAHKDDTPAGANKLAEKAVNLRIFNDNEGKMNLSVKDVAGSILAVSNFTVYGDAAKQRRPSFMESAPFEAGKQLFDQFLESVRAEGVQVQTGIFGAHMDVELINDGPVTVILEVAPTTSP